MTWANNIYTGLTSGGISAYLYWAGVKDGDETNGMLIQINSDGSLTPSGRLWAFGMFSRYIRPGAVRVDITGAPDGVSMSAFKNPDGTLSVQILNNNDDSASVEVDTSGAYYENAQGYISDESTNGIEEYDVGYTVGHVTPSIPGHSMVTVMFTDPA